MADIAIGLHGGCDTLTHELQTKAEWAEGRAQPAQALRAGWVLLHGGSTALDAEQAAVVVLEDSLRIGSGTYADDGACAVSRTGRGEAFVRRVAAYDLAACMRCANQSLAYTMVFENLSAHCIGAGLVALSATGNSVEPFNTLGMCCGWIWVDGQMVVVTHKGLHPMVPA